MFHTEQARTDVAIGECHECCGRNQSMSDGIRQPCPIVVCSFGELRVTRQTGCLRASLRPAIVGERRSNERFNMLKRSENYIAGAIVLFILL